MASEPAKGRTILESIKNQIEVAKGHTLPKSALAKACNYTLTFWPTKDKQALW
jgi:hypothetical protein